jgi:hypothetical protein
MPHAPVGAATPNKIKRQGGSLQLPYDSPHLLIHTKNVLHSLTASLTALNLTAPLNSFLRLKLVSD